MPRLLYADRRVLRLLLFILFLSFGSRTFAQDKTAGIGQSDSHSDQILDQIQSDYEHGQISLDQKVLYEFDAGFRPQALPSGYQTGPIKCGLPLIHDYQVNRGQLSPATIQEIESMLQPRTQAQKSYISPSGKFKINYDISGSNAVPAVDGNQNNVPDYVEWVAAAADSSWREEVQRLGFTDPVVGNSSPYPIFIENINSYGYTDYGSNRGLSADTYIVVHNNFNGFPGNTDPEGNQKGAIKVTVAHELKHAIEYANSKWYGWQSGNLLSPHATNWAEMDAVSMEEAVYDTVNDYYNYITDASSIFLSSDHAVPVAYSGVTWFLYFRQHYGSQFWTDVWSRIKARYEQEKNKSNPDYLTMIEAVTNALQQDYDTSFGKAFTESQQWHYASGDYSRQKYGFEERKNYPTPTINVNLAARDSISQYRSLPPLSSGYTKVTKGEPLVGYVRVIATFQNTMGNVGLIGFFKDGTTKTIIRPENTTTKWDLMTPWKWDDINSIGIITANSSDKIYSSYKLNVTLYSPEQVALLQNYPNPFNSSTTITLSLPQEMNVKLNVYNSVGKLVEKLRDGLMPPGFYQIPFEAGSLASGVYFYRLVTDKKVIVKKMALIK